MSTQEESAAHKDCLACRLSSGGVLSLASLYVAYQGLKRPRPVERSLMMASAGGEGKRDEFRGRLHRSDFFVGHIIVGVARTCQKGVELVQSARNLQVMEILL